MQDETWTWVGEDGVEHRGIESQLTTALSDHRLPAYTLVTRASWLDWLPAMAVAELQWALAPQARDLVRSPTLRTNEPKFPPPIHDYPALRARFAQLSGMPGASSRPRSSIPSSPHLELSHYADDDFDEPTVQIDAEELERALHESRAEEAAIPTPRSAARVDPPAPPVGHELKRRALAQRLAHKMPTRPGYSVSQVPPSAPQTPRAAAPFPSPPSQPPPTPPSIPSAPIPSAPIPSAPGPTSPHAGSALPSSPRAAGYSLGGASGPLTPRQSSAASSFPPPGAGAEVPPFAANEPTLTSRISVLPENEPRRRGKGWLLLMGTVGLVAGAAWLASGGRAREAARVDSAPQPSLPAQSAPPAQEPANVVPRCTVDKQIQLSEFAHAQVRPLVTPLTDPPRLAIGFAQTGRIAAGLTLEPRTFEVTRLYSDNQTSPLWSVSPTLVAGELKFRTSRAASTLRSTVGLPTSPPLYFGLNREGFAARGDSDLIDRLVWKSEWDTISTPDVAPLSDGSLVVTMRVGGERGKIATGRISAGGAAMGELELLTTGTQRLDPPSVFVEDEHRWITYAAGDRPLRDKIFVADGPVAKGLGEPREVLRMDSGVSAPSLARLGKGALALQFTRGVAGKQEVLFTSLSEALEAKGDPIVVSPAGRDAYEGFVVTFGETPLSVFFVRQEYGHELWATRLSCE